MEKINNTVIESYDKHNNEKNFLITFETWLSNKNVEDAKKLNLIDLTEQQLETLSDFLKTVSENQLEEYLLFVIDTRSDIISEKKLKDFMRGFSDMLRKIRKDNNSDGKSSSIKDVEDFVKRIKRESRPEVLKEEAIKNLENLKKEGKISDVEFASGIEELESLLKELESRTVSLSEVLKELKK